jgi:competence ComEA-like helix-hairpin-helix protein
VQLLSTKRHFYYLFLLIFILTACKRVQSQSKRPQPLPQDLLIQVYFNHTQSEEYKETYRQQTRLGDDLEKQIIDSIFQAKSTVDVAVQELRLPKVAEALVERHKAGIKVRLILENNYSRPWSSFTSQEVKNLEKREQERYQEFSKFVDINKDGKISTEEVNQRDALIILRNGKIPWIDDTADGSKGSSLMHHKFVIIDQRITIATSANFTLSDIHGDFDNPNSLGNANSLLKIDSPELASIFTEEFNLMYAEKKFGLKKPLRPPKQITLGNSTITVNFSPTSPTQPWIITSNGLIGKTLNLATKSIDTALFVFSEQRIANIIGTRHEKNVKIRSLIEPSFAYRPYSEALDMMGVALSNKCKYEVDNHPWQNPITTVGVPILSKGDLLHHKFGVIDNQTVITGSHNWSEAANYGNDEAVLIISNPIIAAHYSQEFERIYRTAKLGLPGRIQNQIKTQQKQCPKITAPSTYENKAIQKVNLNTASQKELEALPGVGKKLASRIIVARQQKAFTSLEDLDKVSGVSVSLREKLGDRITW